MQGIEPSNVPRSAAALPACGPYVAAAGGDIEATLVVKAAPERSTKYGETVCTAAILDNGSLVRLYPVPWMTFWSGRLPKWVRIRAKVIPSDERAARPESHKLLGDINPVESPLLSKSKKTPWEQRTALLSKGIAVEGMQQLRDDQTNTKRSLGIVKVRELIDFRITGALDQIVEQADYRTSAQQTLTGEAIKEGSRIDKLKHVFRYRWRCSGPCCDDDTDGRGYHDTTCEDWELFEAFRDWRKKYPTDLDLLHALKNKYYDEIGQSQLYFIMGTPSDPKTQNSWMIVGLFYPGIGKYSASKPTICAQPLAPEQVLQPDTKFDDVLEKSGRLATSKPRKGTLDSFF